MRISLVIPALCLFASQINLQAQKSHAPTLAENYGKLPLSFEANHGQTDPQVKFLSRGQGYSLFLTDSAAVLTLTKHEAHSSIPGQPTVGKADVVRMELAGATPGLRIEGTNKLPGIANYFIGQDPAGWHNNIPTYAQVKYRGVYPGVDLVYYGKQGQLEYDFLVAPGADPKPVQLHFAGARKLMLSPEGDLVITAQSGEIAFHKPVAYQLKDGQRQLVDGRFTLLANNTIGFSLGNYDRGEELVIDPTLAYSTYLGGTSSINCCALAIDTTGDAYVAGQTTASGFPITSGALQTTVGAGLFVTKTNAAGTALIYSTYYGGTSLAVSPGPSASAIVVDASGNAYVAGSTPPNFPVTPGAFQTASGYPTSRVVLSGYVMKLNPSGSALVYSTYLGGNDAGPYDVFEGDVISGIALDPSNNAYVTGTTGSHTFPVTASAYQKVNNAPTGSGQMNTFVTELNSTGTALVYSTYLGGKADGGLYAGGDIGEGIAVDSSGHAYVTGLAGSSNFPVTSGAYQSVNNSGTAGTCYITKLNPGGSTLAYSTYLGGSGSDGEGDRPFGIAIDTGGNAYITGYTNSLDYPTTSGALETENRQGGTAFVTKMNSTGTALVYSTFLGPQSSGATTRAIAVDQADEAIVTGSTYSPDFEVTPDAFQSTNNGLVDPDSPNSNAFLTQFNSTGSALIYSTYLGGDGGGADGYGDTGTGIALDSLGNAYIAGSAGSTNFPVTPGAYQSKNKALDQTDNAFIAKFALHGATITDLTSSSNPQGPSANVTFTAAVVPVSGMGTPTGFVEFRNNGSLLGQEPVAPSGSATYSTSSLPVGMNVIVAGYLGDSNNSSSSSVLTQTILSEFAATPVISPANGAFTSAFQATITTSTNGSTIHYTLDGSMPSAASPTYTGPIQVTESSVLKAVTIEPGAPVSAVATANYVINSFPGSIQFAPGTYFGDNASSLVINGSAKIAPEVGLQLTDLGANEAGSAFYGTPVNVKSFTTTFQFQSFGPTAPYAPVADGFTFTIQNTGPQALGGAQAGLGYVGIHHSIAIKFDLYNNAGEGPDSTGIYTAGNLPTVPAFDLTPSGVNLHSTDTFNVTMTYDGTTLNVTITDTDSGASYSHAYAIDIPAAVFGTTAYVGFTGGTGAGTAQQTIISWNYSTSPTLPSYPNGFVTKGMTLNGAAISGPTLDMLPGYIPTGATSAFFSSPVSVAAFTTNFNFAINQPVGDGFTFAIQNTGANAVGGGEAGLGYVGIHRSVAIKFDILNNAGEGPNSTGIYTAGNIPTVPSVDLTDTGIDLQSGHLMNAQISYDGTNLTLYLTDLVTSASWSHTFPIDIPTAVGGASAFVGFTAGTGGEDTAMPAITTWTYGLP